MNWPLLIIVLLTLCMPLAAFALAKFADRNAARNEIRRSGIGHVGD